MIKIITEGLIEYNSLLTKASKGREETPSRINEIFL